MRVVIIGSGLAGQLAALRLADGPGLSASTTQEIVLVTGGRLPSGSSLWAQGGIAAATGADDAPESHTADTIAAGAGLTDPAVAAALCADGPAAVAELIARGVVFDRDADGELSRGLEAAHSRRRVLHAGGDATGSVIVTALSARIRESRVEVRERTLVTRILTEGGRATGVELDGPEGRSTLTADAVVLATGGAGALYPHTTNPETSIGSGIVLAYAAGAAVADLEFVQFHPTVLAGGGLVSEAVRGEGAVLRDESGRRFMLDVDARAELAPRDIVARAIAATMAAQGGRPVQLDATGLGGASALAARFPTIDRLVRRLGIDWATELVPVTPAAHYAMGGVLADLDGRTTVAGLFAIGETAATGVHGANRLASNSLLEAAVSAMRCAALLQQEPTVWGAPLPVPAAAEPAAAVGATLASDPGRVVPSATPFGAALPTPSATRSAAASTAPSPTPSTTQEIPIRLLAAPGRDDLLTHGSDPLSGEEIRQLAWQHLGLVRDGVSLASLRSRLAGSRPADALATTLLPLARLVTEAALARVESRGAHFRSDAPATDPAAAVRSAWMRAMAASPELSTTGVPAAASPAAADATAAAATAAADDIPAPTTPAGALA
ncbi:L-aspartate oxidase [Microcella flavibacter]|uniref:L-aspartate oxidase n=1 Tax=Microcella flavibacter TaxID=1804990 RepID=UPI001E4B7324|nr:FAD-binding protein [Microcella flavibacter]